MLVIRLFFPSGMYNMSWPPSSFRLAGDMATACIREFPRMQGRRLEAVLSLLSAELSYALPAATRVGSTGFVKVSSDEPAFMVFCVTPTREQLFDLKQLLAVVKTIGNNPVWTDADVTVSSTICINCRRSDATGSVPVETLRSAGDYLKVRELFAPDLNWIEAILSRNTDQSPAMAVTTYKIAGGFFTEQNSPISVVHYSLQCDNLTDITDTLSVAEAVRRKLMGISRNLNGGDPQKVSKAFSSKNEDGTTLQNHTHAYYLPFTLNNGGMLDELIVYTKSVFSEHDISVLKRLTSIRREGNSDMKFSIEYTGDKLPFRSKTWISATPFATARHHRKSRGEWKNWMVSELTREISNQDMVNPSKVVQIKKCSDRRLREFNTARKDEESHNLSAFSLCFEEEQHGPFAIGSLAHFGIGLFLPDDGQQ